MRRGEVVCLDDCLLAAREDLDGWFVGGSHGEN